MKQPYPKCPEMPENQKRRDGRRAFSESEGRPQHHKDDWLSRLEAEQEAGGLDAGRYRYPADTADSPPARMPQDISRRQDAFNMAQRELGGHFLIPYFHLPPKEARFYDSIDSRSIAAGATATVIATTTIDLQNAVLRWFGNELTDTTGYPNVSWTINIDGVNFGPWNGITLSLGSINSPSLIFIPLVLGQTFSVVATNNSGSTAYTVRTRIKGWKW